MKLNDLAKVENQLNTKNKTKTIKQQIEEQIKNHHKEMIKSVFGKDSYAIK